MPELPEVENTRRYLIQAGLLGRTFTGAEIGWAKAVQTPSLEEFVLGITGGTAQAIERRGKYILISLQGSGGRASSTLVLHLGMTGGLRIQHSEQPPHPMVRHVFHLDDATELRFQDGRKFGKMWLAGDPKDILPPLGPDPLEGDFTTDLLTRAFSGKIAPVKALLLEQAIVSGMGNLYADESLFLAGIHPLRAASEITHAEVSRLRDSIVNALSTGVQKYDESRNEDWPDPPMGLSPWSIPRKQGDPCPRCGGPVSAIRVRGRGTCFCPKCQG